MDLTMKEIVERYRKAAGAYGKAVPLGALGISREDTERAFDILDEDYHISRFFHFAKAAGASYSINGFPQTHVSIDKDIEELL
jgi:N-formylglutamate amidohydrolase